MTRYYMIVTNDVYELPVGGPMTAKRAAEILGIKESTVRWRGMPAGVKRDANRKQKDRKASRPYKVVPVELNDEETK